MTPARGVAQALVGVVLAAAGAALLGRHLPRTGLSVAAAVGLVALAAGALLLVAPVRAVWRRRGWERLWLVPASVVALLVAWPVAVAVVATVVPATPVDGPAPTVGPVRLTEVAVPTRDGVRLSGWWGRGDSGAAVVLLHGSGSNKATTVRHAEVLARHGYGVLLLDARGHGDSAGRGMDLGWYGEGDVQAALDLLQRQEGVDPARLAVVGMSMGGEEAIGAAAADPRVRAVVAEGVTGRTEQDKAQWLPGGVPGAVQRGIDRVTYWLVGVLTPAPRPEPLHEAVRAASSTPILLVTAGRVPDEARAAAALRAAAPDRVEVWDVPGSAHSRALRTAPQEWERRVVAFLGDALPAR